jgi:hypothetical protein
MLRSVTEKVKAHHKQVRRTLLCHRGFSGDRLLIFIVALKKKCLFGFTFFLFYFFLHKMRNARFAIWLFGVSCLSPAPQCWEVWTCPMHQARLTRLFLEVPCFLSHNIYNPLLEKQMSCTRKSY